MYFQIVFSQNQTKLDFVHKNFFWLRKEMLQEAVSTK